MKRIKRFLDLWPRISQTWASGWLYTNGNRHAYLARDFRRYNKIQYILAKVSAVRILSAHYGIIEGKLWRILSESDGQIQYSSATYDL